MQTVGDAIDRGMFEALAMPLFDSLYNFAHWLTQDRDEAEDLVQETYAKALKGFASFQPGTDFRAWMYKILRNTFLTSRTGLKNAAMYSVEAEEEVGNVIAASGPTPEAVVIAEADRQILQEAIEGLSLPFREIVLLCDLEEMSYQEASLTLGVPIGTVMSRLSRARKALREAVRAKLEGNQGQLKTQPTFRGSPAKGGML
jgi:RNA polymerase sigma-70 factor, ECF subfamily